MKLIDFQDGNKVVRHAKLDRPDPKSILQRIDAMKNDKLISKFFPCPSKDELNLPKQLPPFEKIGEIHIVVCG